MQYVTCPICGANLDPGERCDCEKKEEPPHANELGSSSTILMPASIIAHIDAEHNNLLRDIRTSGNIPAKEIVQLVRSKYPGYDKMLQSKCENPGKYGVGLTSDAMRLVIARYAPGLLAISEDHTITQDKPVAAPKRRGDTHRLKRCIRCRLEDKDYERLMEHIHDAGFDTVQAWLTYMVRNLLKERKE